MSDVASNAVKPLFPALDFSNPIYDLIHKRFYQNISSDDGGQFLALPFPTGIGKTYNTLSLLFQFLIDEGKRQQTLGSDYKPRVCYFITNSVDNVFEAYSDLQARINHCDALSAEQKALLLSQLLYTPSNSSTLLEMIRNHRKAFYQIMALFEIKQYKALWNDLQQLIKNDDALTQMTENIDGRVFIAKTLEDKAVSIYSRLINHIQMIQRSSETVKSLYKHRKALSLLIPGILLKESVAQTRVVFMTTKKFLHGLQQTKGKFYPAKNLKDQILIIDEVDRQQAEILDHLVKSNEVDILGTLCTIHSNLKSQKLSQLPEYKGISELFESYLEMLVKVFEEHELQYSFNLHTSLKKSKKQGEVLLFSDKLATHISSYKDRLVFKKNAETMQHEIGIKGGIGEGEHEFPKFAGLLERMVNKDFFAVIQKAEERYRKNIADQGISEKSLRTAPEVIATILKQFNLYGLRDWLKNQLSFLSGRKRSKRALSRNYHTRGMRMIEVAYLEDVLDSVIFKYHGYDITPTGMLASWVDSGANILGISATAECESVIHNFDMNYLKTSLGSRYITLSRDERTAVQDYYNRERDYAKAGIQLNVKSYAEDRTYIKLLVKKYAAPHTNESEIYRQLFPIQKEADAKHYLEELAKICRAIETFMACKDNRYMMLMLNAHRYLNTEVDSTTTLTEAGFLNWYIDRLAQKNKVETNVVFGMNAQSLKGGEFQSKVIDHLETTPGKVIVFTSYSTMSSGKNPDYIFDPILENGSLSQVGTHQIDKTDIDTIYLQCPSNLIAVNDQDSRMTNQLRLMSYGLVLQEANFNSPTETNDWCETVLTSEDLKTACTRLKGRYYSIGNKNIANHSQDALFAIYRMVEQALGRSARTGMKRHNIYLFLDEDLVPLIAQDHRQTAILTHEYRSVRDYAKSQVKVRENRDHELKRLHNLALKSSLRSWQDIYNRLEAIKKGADEKVVKRWLSLRELALTSPALRNEPVQGEFYLRSQDAGEYCFTRGGNERNFAQYIFFEPKQNNGIQKQVSESVSRLPILMKNKIVKSAFEEQGYCTKWPEEAHYLLTPPMFINIYLGALGEVAGSAILQSQGCTLSDLPLPQYEKFDAYLNFNGYRALIDFKHWDLSAWNSQSDEVKRSVMASLQEKLSQFPNQRLIICNTLAENENDEIRYYDQNFQPIRSEESVIIEIPSLLMSNGDLAQQNILALLTWMQNEVKRDV